MKLTTEVVFLRTRVVLTYVTKKDRQEAIAGAKEATVSVSESVGGASNWSYLMTSSALIKEKQA